ncbi:MAG TPA: hypothetical protein VMT42_00270 [candidate division Zixibacteria bacterium]|nr:hypothetical protein [candidate division Zixibacteria bacterium]
MIPEPFKDLLLTAIDQICPVMANPRNLVVLNDIPGLTKAVVKVPRIAHGDDCVS